MEISDSVLEKLSKISNGDQDLLNSSIEYYEEHKKIPQIIEGKIIAEKKDEKTEEIDPSSEKLEKEENPNLKALHLSWTSKSNFMSKKDLMDELVAHGLEIDQALATKKPYSEKALANYQMFQTLEKAGMLEQFREADSEKYELLKSDYEIVNEMKDEIIYSSAQLRQAILDALYSERRMISKSFYHKHRE